MPSFFRSDGWVKTSQGPAVAGAQIWVALQPANTSTPPITPLAFIFSDPNGLVPITQPILTDGFGHYDFYVLPGVYTVVVAFSNIVQQVYVDQSIGSVSVTPGGGNPYTAGANIQINGNVISAVLPPPQVLPTLSTLYVPITSQPGSYQLAATDNGSLILMTSGSANSLTIAPDSTVNFPVGYSASVRQMGVGATTIVAGGGVTITGPGTNLTLRAQFASAQVIKLSANTWAAIGDLTGV